MDVAAVGPGQVETSGGDVAVELDQVRAGVAPVLLRSARLRGQRDRRALRNHGIELPQVVEAQLRGDRSQHRR